MAAPVAGEVTLLPLSSRRPTSRASTMKFLILAALVAVASAQFSDDVFQFGGLKKSGSAFLQSSPVYSTYAAQPVYTKKYTTYSSAPVYSAFAAQPAVNKQYTIKSTNQVYSSPLLTQSAFSTLQKPIYAKTIEQELPFYNQHYYDQHYFAQPAAYGKQYYDQRYYAQPATYGQQYFVKNVDQRVAYPKLAVANDALATYASAYNGPQFRILEQSQDADPAGNYKVSYATENGIQSSEEGVLVNGSEGPVIASRGAYSYTGPDGVQYTVNWVADENGYRASGAHLPQAPAIPEEIVRSLQFNAANGDKFDEQGKPLGKLIIAAKK